MPRRWLTNRPSGPLASADNRLSAPLPWGVPTPVALLVAVVALGCGPRVDSIKVDGSSTVFPISEAVAEAFLQERPDVRVTVGQSGTGGGMKKFTAGEIDVCDASRAIKPAEAEALAKAGVGYREFRVAFDGIAVVLNPQNDWVDSLTVEQLAQVWRPDDPAKTWSDVDPSWPDAEIRLYGPGPENGTFDYFTEAIVGEEKASRSDYSVSEDDNVLVTGVSQDKHAMAYFGYAYYAENQDVLRVAPIQNGDGEPVTPSLETIRSDEYTPLSRPLYLYVRDDLLQRPEGEAFIRFYLEKAGELAEEVGYVRVSDEVEAANQRELAEALGDAPPVEDAADGEGTAEGDTTDERAPGGATTDEEPTPATGATEGDATE